MSGSAGIIASMANALSAISSASSAVISRAPGRRVAPGRWLFSNDMRQLRWRRPARHARGIADVTCGGQMRGRLMGWPTDSHASFLRGSAAAPPAIRAALHSDHANMAAESGEDVDFADAGDLPLDETAADVERIRDAAANAVREHSVPLFLGGDHMVTYPIVAGFAAERGPLAILH